ncbi:MAG: hypothetical protein K0R19_3139 [Bacillota bacterium]|jgi:hypothetical protein|nr:hypothetical protein [Bacillota bacterium]
MSNQEGAAQLQETDQYTYEEVQILMNFVIRWLEIIHWTRSLIQGVIGNLPEQSSIGKELFLKLPSDFYNEFNKYYTDEEAQEFLNIITNLISDNWQLTNAYKNKDALSVEISKNQLYEVADRLSEFLARVNTYIDHDEIKKLLYGYIELKNNEIKALATGNYDLETQIFEQIEEQAILIGTYMAMGTIKKRRNEKSHSDEVETPSSIQCTKF